jgi:hypothetical protein
MKFTILAALFMAAVAAAPAHADDNAARVADLSRRFTYKNVTDDEAGHIFRDLGIKSSYNPKREGMKNPDPAWIPGWDSLSLTDEVQTAIIQAAINRTWTAQVTKDYARYRQAWTAIENKLRPELEKAKQGTYYARAAALAALYDAVVKQALADRVLLGDVGFVNEIVLAMADLHRETKREFLFADYMAHRNIDIARYVTAARPWAPGNTERELFIANSQDNGNPDTAKLPTMSEYGKAFAAVKWPTLEHGAAAKQAAAKLVEANAAALAIPRVDVPSLFLGQSPLDSDPALRWVSGGDRDDAANGVGPLVVTKVGKTVTLQAKENTSIPYGCKTDPLNPMQTIGCKYKNQTKLHTFAVTFPELPDGVTLQNGDRVAFYGDLVSKKDTKKAASYKLTARALASVKRDGADVWPAK